MDPTIPPAVAFRICTRAPPTTAHCAFRRESPSATVLITGGTDFIGSNLVARLAGRGDRVSISDRVDFGQKWRNIARHEIDEFVAPEALDDFLQRRGAEIDFVYHMGAISSTTETDAELIVETNFRLSQRIWRWCTRHETPPVYASSAATYGDGSRGFRDDGSGTALARLRPLNPYAWSKHVFDRWVAREVESAGGQPPMRYGLKFVRSTGPTRTTKAPPGVHVME